jgi:hypothetical protein
MGWSQRALSSQRLAEQIIPVLFQGEPIIQEFGNTKFFIQSVK